jgi:hypothetical protein
MRTPVYDQGAVSGLQAGIALDHQESAMRIQANPPTAATLPAAPTKSSRTAHTPAMKAAPPAAARPPAKPATVASPAKAAEVAAAPETYGGAGSLLDAEA